MKETKEVRWRSLEWLQGELKEIEPEALEHLKQSLRTNGFAMPFHIWQDRSGTRWILDGHQRQRAMEELEREGARIPDHLPGTFIRCRDHQAAQKMVLVYSSLYARVTDGGLFTFLADAKLDLNIIKPEIFLPFIDLDRFTENHAAPQAVAPDDIPTIPKKAITKRGDLYEIGEHRIYCGDATDYASWQMLGMKASGRTADKDRASLIFTDPPYGVSYQAQSERWEPITGDDKTRDELMRLLVPAFKNLERIAFPTAAFYIWHASTTREDFAAAIKAAGLQERQYIIWIKQLLLGRSDYHWSHEPCFYAAKAGERPSFYGDRTHSTIWRASLEKRTDTSTVIGPGVLLIDGQGGSLYLQPRAPKAKKLRTIRLQEGGSIHLQTQEGQADAWEISREHGYEHPTQKPVELARRAIENSSKPGEIVADAFLGSGTTLMAAQMTGRICIGTEIEPRYCDVIVSRWVKFTGCHQIKRNGKPITWDA